jgi:hypothetical protein
MSPMSEGVLRDRTVPLRSILDGLDELRRERAQSVRELAHAVCNALFVVKISAEASLAKRDDPAMRDVQQAVDQIDRLLAAFREREDGASGLIRLPPQRISVPAVADAARAAGLEVVVTDDAPAEIEVDPLVFARLLGELTKLEIAAGELLLTLSERSPRPKTRAMLASIGAVAAGDGETLRAPLPITTTAAG